MAKTYLEVNPSAKVAILESAASLGGVWAEERIYPGLKSNNTLGSYEYSDFPLDEKTFGVKPDEHIPGAVLHNYFQKYAEHFDIYRRVRFNSKVESAERRDSGGWIVRRAQNGRVSEEKPILAHKLVISTGLTSEPFVPSVAGSESFDAPIFHAKYLHDRTKETFKASNVVIMGGSKSAYDAAYAHASAGVHVDWVIRESGHGPGWMAPALVTPLKKKLELLVGVRFLTWFSPCIWGDCDGFGTVRSWLHSTKVGRFFVDSFWKILANDLITANGYDTHPETKKLKPWTAPFWVASSLSIFNYPTDFFQYVRDGTVKVHIADVSHLSPHTVHLSTGSTLRADALICSTGWKHNPTIKLSPGLDEQLGLPHSTTQPEDDLVAKADHEILTRFPCLADQPIINTQYKPLTGADNVATLNRPYRLYRFMVPPAYINDRSIAYCGMIMSIHTTTCAQAQALWLTAYFSNGLLADRQSRTRQPFPDAAVRWETALHSRFGKWRYPAGYGSRYPDFVFDGVPYIDMLLRDLGVGWLRKGGWGWREWFEPYGPGDYRGLVDEWRIEVSGCCWGVGKF